MNEEDFSGVNSAYVLLRNIEYSYFPLSIEDQVKLRVASLNYTHQTLQSTKQLAAIQRDLTSRKRAGMWADVIPLLCEDIRTRVQEDEQERIDNLICLALLHQPPIQDIPLHILVDDILGITVTVTRSSIVFYRLQCVNWIKLLADHPHIHAILGALLSAQSRNTRLRLLWRFTATEEEVAEALCLVNPADKRRVSRLIEYHRQPHHQHHYLRETLAAFDEIVKRGCNEKEFNVIIGLLCNDFQGPRSSSYNEPPENWEKEHFESLHNPWLRLIGYAITGNTKRLESSFMSDPRMTWSIGSSFADYLLSDHPFADLSILPQLRNALPARFRSSQGSKFHDRSVV
ncbi:hypothetical protein CPB86DRAFT_316796 [Serendipita vermifera]|nr:hypothetical protein CPB86DRAFT_316796 [Serendipita vermifera]